MSHAILLGANGRRYEVNFGDAPVRAEIYSNEYLKLSLGLTEP